MPSPIRGLLAAAWMACLLAVSPSIGQAEERYYLMVFAYQPKVPLARLSHTFVTFVKVNHHEQGPCHDSLVVDTISWLPASCKVHTLRMRPETGRNFPLESTLNLGCSVGAETFMWGPFEIPCHTYQRLARRKSELDSGRILYRAIDGIVRQNNISNCIHAVSDADPSRRRAYYPVALYGVPASRHIVRVMYHRGVLLSEGHHWLIPRVGLDRFPVNMVRFDPRGCGSHQELGRTCQYRDACWSVNADDDSLAADGPQHLAFPAAAGQPLDDETTGDQIATDLATCREGDDDTAGSHDAGQGLEPWAGP